ncbi:hypothetical protein GF360_00715 [candidate division WWE3 bacterium]|nr:hypothetical protein [candidate division WWE3 bacterium]
MEPNALFFTGFETIFSYALLFGEAVYVLFAFITVRQVRLMNASFETIMKPVFLTVARLHFVFSLGLFLLSLLLLL